MKIPIITFDQLQTFLQYLAGLSVITFVLSLVCIPLLVSRLPCDFFLRYSPGRKAIPREISAGYLVVLLLKNFLGLALLFAGIAMLFLPGQGLITIILSFSLMNFPYKNRLIYALIRRPPVQAGLNWIREKTRQPPFSWSFDH